VVKADLLWLAGLLEGEGYFGGSPHRQLSIQLAMNDRDVVEKAASIMGGKERITPKRKGGTSEVSILQFGGSRAAAWMMMLWQFMGQRRKARIAEALQWWKTRPVNNSRIQPYCKRGHEFTEQNTYFFPDGRQRMCRKCHNDRNRAYREKHRGLALQGS